MKINYQIMSEKVKTNDGWCGQEKEAYKPNYDELIKNATCEEEAEYIRKVKERNSTFAFNMVYITKQKCGHYEIFQIPCNEYYTVERNLKFAEEHAVTSKCTRCVCNWG